MRAPTVAVDSERRWHTLVATCLAATMPLLYVYMPRPPVPGAHLLVYPALAGILFVLCFVIIGRSRQVDSRIALLSVLLIATAGASGASAIMNAPALRATAPLETLRPAIFAVFLIYGYYVAALAGERTVSRGLLWAAYLILGGQLLIAITQLFGMSVFDVMYTEDKSRPFGRLVRVTGSLGNPNIFGWIVAQMAVVIVMLSTSWSRFLWVSLGALLVVASGSRTILVLFPFMVALASLLARGGSQMKSWKTLAFSVGIGAAFLFVVMSLGAYFPYLAQLQSVITSGSLTSVNAFAARLSIWERGYVEFSGGDGLTWLFGLGSRETTRVLDNDILYVLFRIGFLGLLGHVALILCSAAIFMRSRRSIVSMVGLQYLCFAVALGFVADTLGGWLTPLLLFYLLGLSVGLSRRTKHRGLPAHHSSGSRPILDAAQGMPESPPGR